ncbi:uncharacterized mitochondrial protein AtMg00810-like [Humulus lupulus]|uniref:uncharacterized mitochondrial protein AtMg00810-like n=1 Tax=Humulus lupulus TaxID=3486 RepID=UPI002B40443B|nr:uncharacterized mitochondrial protein AtMg00810-like [Humulus lupulus]
MVLIYVDDILITGSSTTQTLTLIVKLNQLFDLKDLGALSYFLGIEVKQTSQGLRLCTYGYDPVEDPQFYRSIVGDLQYLTLTHPDISFSVYKVCQFMHAPFQLHWCVIKCILRYLSSSINYGLHLRRSSSLDLVEFCHGDWVANPDDCHSTNGFCICFGLNLVAWQAKKQQTASRSSNEVEYRSLATVTAELTWLTSLLAELHHNPSFVLVIWCDNLSTVMLAANPALHARTKHIELDLYFVKVQNHTIQVQHVSSYD